MTSRGHRQIEHTADLALEVWAPDQPALLNEAGRALIGILTEDATISSQSERQVYIDSLDAEDRLVQWLNEIVVLALTNNFLFNDGAISLTDNGLSATILGESNSLDKVKTELKSVTYHDLQLNERADGWRAVFIVDV